MIIRNVTIALLVFLPGFLFAQKGTYKGFPSLIWPKLYDIKFETVKDNLGEYDKPIFSQAAKTLDGKRITVPGYMVPFETGLKSAHFMLSSLPLNACFFCGGGGPETVIEVFLKKESTLIDKPIEVTGTLKLNASNPDQMIYILQQAEITAEEGS
jgi:hypothetical protein